MADDKYNAFDYYNTEPPLEGAALPPEEAAASAPEDEFNEQVHGSDAVKRVSGSVRSVALALAVGGMALSFVISSGRIIPGGGVSPAESSVSGTTASDDGGGKPGESVIETSVTPSPKPTPSPTPAPVPTEDLGLRLDSFKIYPLYKDFLAEVRFTLATNCGIELSSIAGSIDANLSIYTGYNRKTNKAKFRHEKYKKEFSMDTAKAVIGSGADNTDNQYVLLVPVKLGDSGNSEDKFSVTLTVSNTLNGNKTEDKVATLKNVGIWNNQGEYSSAMFDAKITRNKDKSFDITLIPKDGIPISNPRVNGVYLFGRGNSTAFLQKKDFNITNSGNTFHVTFKKPKKAPKKGSFGIGFFADYELSDSNGNTYKGSAYKHVTKKY